MSHMFDFISGKRRGKPAELAASLEHALWHLGTALEENERLRAAAERVVGFDWSDNDDDAVAAIDELRKVLANEQETK